MVQSISPPFTPHYPWLQGEPLFANELNAAIANAVALGATYTLAGFGGRSDGVTDDSAALNNAIAAILSLPTGGKLMLGPGRTVLGSAIVASIPAGMALTIEGMGATASELYFSNATDGLKFTMLNSGAEWGSVHLAALGVTRGPTGSPANTGIALLAQNVGTNYTLKCSLRDLLIRGNHTRTTQWQNALVMTGLSGVLDGIQIYAPNGSSTGGTDAGITIAGFSSSQFAVAHYISNSSVQGYSTGIAVGDFTQGVFLNNCSIIGDYDGVHCTNTGGTSDTEAIQITNCTFAAGHRCIWLQGWGFNGVVNCSLQKFNGAASPAGYAGFEAAQSGTQGSNFTTFIGNTVTGVIPSTVADIGIIINSGSSCTVTGNTVSSMSGAGTIGIWLKGATVQSVVSGNVLHNMESAIVQDNNPSTNFVWGNNFTSPGGTDFYSPINMGLPNGNPCAVGFGTTDSPTPLRWFIGTDGVVETMPADPVTPVNIGSNYHIVPHDDNQNSLGAAIKILRATGQIIMPPLPLTASYANDAAAQAGGVQVGGLYRNGSAVQVRVS